MADPAKALKEKIVDIGEPVKPIKIAAPMTMPDIKAPTPVTVPEREPVAVPVKR